MSRDLDSFDFVGFVGALWGFVPLLLAVETDDWLSVRSTSRVTSGCCCHLDCLNLRCGLFLRSYLASTFPGQVS